MNQQPAYTASPHLSPYSSPLYPPSVQHNARILSSIATLSACFSGLIAGILGLENIYGFLLYLTTSIFSALTIGILKCGFDIAKFVPSTANVQGGSNSNVSSNKSTVDWRGWWVLMGISQENLLGFLLFWIGAYAFIHVYD